ncbi:MAG TPA: pyridoxal phosphate-dependent aminotransferase [Candidatus Limnocylindrales bacterium]
MKPLSKRLGRTEPSATLAVSDRARELRAQGRDVIALAGGDPDFPTPAHIVEAAAAAMRAGDTHYPPTRGRPALVEAIVEKLERDNGVRVRPSQVIVTPGAKWALYIALAALVDPGDEVLILDPAWVSYAPMVGLNDAVPVHVALPSADGHRVTEPRLRAALTERTKAILVNSPGNPTGRVLGPDEIAAIVAVATSEDLYVVSDEIYEKLVFDGHAHRSIAAEPGMAERTAVVNGFSKAYAMTGWRLGWLAAPEPVAALAMNLHSQGVTAAASFAMAGGVAALRGPQECVAEMVEAYAARRSFVVRALNEIAGIECAAPEGAFYLFPRFPGSDRDSVGLAEALLERADIASVPGIAFGASGEGHLRFSIATAPADLERAVERLARIAGELRA